MDKFDPINLVIVALIAGGAVPIVFSWRQAATRALARLSLVPLVITSFSYLWLLALLWWPEVFGPHYSDVRFNTISINLLAGVIAVALVLLFARGARVTYSMASIWVTVLWSYVAVISSVV